MTLLFLNCLIKMVKFYVTFRAEILFWNAIPLMGPIACRDALKWVHFVVSNPPFLNLQGDFKGTVSRKNRMVHFLYFLIFMQMDCNGQKSSHETVPLRKHMWGQNLQRFFAHVTDKNFPFQCLSALLKRPYRSKETLFLLLSYISMLKVK